MLLTKGHYVEGLLFNFRNFLGATNRENPTKRDLLLLATSRKVKKWMAYYTQYYSTKRAIGKMEPINSFAYGILPLASLLSCKTFIIISLFSCFLCQTFLHSYAWKLCYPWFSIYIIPKLIKCELFDLKDIHEDWILTVYILIFLCEISRFLLYHKIIFFCWIVDPLEKL